MVLLALSLAPAIAIIFYIIGKDKYNKEPFVNLFISFVLGIVSCVPAIMLESFLSAQLQAYFPVKTILFYAIFSFFVVALSEEGCKYIMLRFYAYRKQAFDE